MLKVYNMNNSTIMGNGIVQLQERILDGDSRKLTCMALPFGRFHWTRWPMGTVVAQDIFQSKLDSIFIGMEGVTELLMTWQLQAEMKWNMTEISLHLWKSV